ncbi:MAG: IS110 family transposase [Candidatus Micrarchaeia archaeon]
MNEKDISQSDDSMRMFVGLDVHKKYTEVAIVDECGVVLEHGRIENDPEKIEDFSKRLSNATVVMESSSSWYWLYEILSRRHRVVLSNPVKTKAIASAKMKTDRMDALMLANLLRGGYIAECYVPLRRVMGLRELVRYRANLVRMRGMVKNRVHAYLQMNNINIGYGPFTEGFLEELRKVKDARIEGYLRIIERLNLEIHEASKMICSEALNDEGARLLMTIPGISFYSALLIISEIGEIDRFPDSSHLVSYAGLAPSTRCSGGVTYHGRITKTGSPYLRWVLNQCTWVHIRSEPDGNIATFYRRLSKKKGNAKAIVAASAKLLKIIYWVLKDRRPYHS